MIINMTPDQKYNGFLSPFDNVFVCKGVLHDSQYKHFDLYLPLYFA